jgi:hypothetical protein
MSSTTCINPIVYFINYASWYISNNPGTTVDQIVDTYNVFPFSENLCCPCQQNFYVLSSDLQSNTGYTLQDFFNIYNSDATNCCINYNFNVSNADVSEGLISIINNIETCCKKDDYNKCVNDLLTLAPEFSSISSIYLNADNASSGIIEWGLVDDNGTNTSLCVIVDALSDKSDTFIKQFVDAIINKGIVINCEPNLGVVVTSVETYISVN